MKVKSVQDEEATNWDIERQCIRNTHVGGSTQIHFKSSRKQNNDNAFSAVTPNMSI